MGSALMNLAAPFFGNQDVETIGIMDGDTYVIRAIIPRGSIRQRKCANGCLKVSTKNSLITLKNTFSTQLAKTKSPEVSILSEEQSLKRELPKKEILFLSLP